MRPNHDSLPPPDLTHRQKGTTMNTTEQFEKALELGLANSTLLLELVRGLDADLLMLAKDEYANTNGFTVKAERATNRLMAIVALVAPELIDTDQ